jgi:curved DNA-binding protein CbpA
MTPDHYQALGVPPHASAEEIRAAYLRLMRASHPDRRPGDPAATERAQRANAAWEVLGHSARKASYDRLRAAGGRPRVRTPAAGRQPPAYSREGDQFRRAFHRAWLRLGAGVFAVGFLLLFLAR